MKHALVLISLQMIMFQKKFKVETQKDYAIVNALNVLEDYFMCLLHYI